MHVGIRPAPCIGDSLNGKEFPESFLTGSTAVHAVLGLQGAFKPQDLIHTGVRKVYKLRRIRCDRCIQVQTPAVPEPEDQHAGKQLGNAGKIKDAVRSHRFPLRIDHAAHGTKSTVTISAGNRQAGKGVRFAHKKADCFVKRHRDHSRPIRVHGTRPCTRSER